MTIRAAFQFALFNRRKVTTWFQATELARSLDATEPEKHDHVNQTLERAYALLFQHPAPQS